MRRDKEAAAAAIPDTADGSAGDGARTGAQRAEARAARIRRMSKLKEKSVVQAAALGGVGGGGGGGGGGASEKELEGLRAQVKALERTVTTLRGRVRELEGALREKTGTLESVVLRVRALEDSARRAVRAARWLAFARASPTARSRRSLRR